MKAKCKIPHGAVWVLALSMGCAPEAPGEERLDEVQVDRGPTQTLTVEDDQQGQLPSLESALTGRLPGDFPADVPIPVPAIVTDFGTSEASRYVELSVPRPVEDVKTDVHARLQGAGWDQSGGSRYTQAGRALDVAVRGDRNGATVRIDYSAAVQN